MLLWLSDFDLIGSGYMQISIALCKALAERGRKVMALGLGYNGSEHNWPFSIIPIGHDGGLTVAIAEDHENPSLLFAGTEFGLFFTLNGGGNWIQLKGGMPVIAVRDIVIQKRENDLVAGTFGRGIYILDDYSLLRTLAPQTLEQESALFPVKNTYMYIEGAPLGLPDKTFEGDSYYTAPNPPFGAVLTYYLKEEIKTKKKMRQEAEKKTGKEGGVIRYPDWKDLRAEDREEAPG